VSFFEATHLKNLIINTMVRSVLIAALVGSAAAFAPASVVRPALENIR
jgi:hypothetical protein